MLTNIPFFIGIIRNLGTMVAFRTCLAPFIYYTQKVFWFQ